MTEAFELLDRQPDEKGWPRWLPGEDSNENMTAERHLFLFVPEIVQGKIVWGGARAACHFVDGADRVYYNNLLKNLDSPFLDHCNACQEVELQHALANL
jgi:hypothetical protein